MVTQSLPQSLRFVSTISLLFVTSNSPISLVHSFYVNPLNNNNNNNINIKNARINIQQDPCLSVKQTKFTVLNQEAKASRLYSSTMYDATAVKNDFLGTVMQLKDEYGIFLIESAAKDRLNSLLESFERSVVSEMPPPSYSSNPSLLLGDWELVLTTASDVGGVSIPSFLNQGPLKDIRDSIRKTTNKYLTVQQRILASGGDNIVDQVDHVLEYDPPKELRDVLENLPEQLTNFNINPLQVSKSKVTLVHKASVESDSSPLLIKITLNQVVWNVAGTSTILDPTGRDLAKINVPFGGNEFLNRGGEFVTTYVDDTIRISRGKQGFINDQIRIFVRKDRSGSLSSASETLIDPDFDDDISPSDVEVL